MTKFKLNLRNVVAIAICLAGVTMFSGCNKEDDVSDNVSTTVTSQMKEITLKTNGGFDGIPPVNYSNYKNYVITIYETFDRLYSIGYNRGQLFCLFNRRSGGGWAEGYVEIRGEANIFTDYDINHQWSEEFDNEEDVLHGLLSISAHSFISVGKVNNLSDISDREIYLKPLSVWNNSRDNWYLSSPRNLPVSPNEGYVIILPSEDNADWLYIRLKIKSYTTDTNGTINSITVQYQTF